MIYIDRSSEPFVHHGTVAHFEARRIPIDRASRDRAPRLTATSGPPWKTTSVGMLRMPWRADTRPILSIELCERAFGFNRAGPCSNTGAIDARSATMGPRSHDQRHAVLSPMASKFPAVSVIGSRRRAAHGISATAARHRACRPAHRTRLSRICRRSGLIRIVASESRDLPIVGRGAAISSPLPRRRARAAITKMTVPRGRIRRLARAGDGALTTTPP